MWGKYESMGNFKNRIYIENKNRNIFVYNQKMLDKKLNKTYNYLRVMTELATPELDACRRKDINEVF